MAILADPDLEAADTRLEHAILSMSTGLTVCMDDYAQGRRQFAKSFSLFRELDHQRGMAWALNTWATMSKFLGEFRDARGRFEEGLAIYRALGSPAGIAGCVSQLAEITSLQGHFEEAESLAREGVAVSLEGGSRTGLAYALLSLGEVLEKVAKFTEAHSVLQQSLVLYNDLGHRNYVTEAHAFLGSVDTHRGRYQEARDQVQRSLELARSQGPPYCIGLNLLQMGSLDLVEGAYAMAQQFSQQGLAAFRELGGHQDDLGWALATLAIAAHRLGDAPGARQHLRCAVEAAADSEAMLSLLWALPAMALVLAGEGEIERAVELYALASRYPLVAKSCWFADVAGNTLAKIAATLPTEQVTGLQKRGRTVDLEATVAELLAELGE